MISSEINYIFRFARCHSVSICKPSIVYHTEGQRWCNVFFSRGVAVHFPTQIRIERQPFAIQCSTHNSHSNKCIFKQESFFQIVDLISVSRFRIIKGLIILTGVKYEIWPFYVPLSITITEQYVFRAFCTDGSVSVCVCCWFYFRKKRRNVVCWELRISLC